MCWFYRQGWHDARHCLGAQHSHTCACYAKYTRACAVATRHFDVHLPMLLKSNPSTYYNHIYPNRGPKAAAACSVGDYWQHYKRVFELLAVIPQEIVPNPDPDLLPFSPSHIWAALGWPYKGNKSPGPSPLPTQLIKHLHTRNDEAISNLFRKVTTGGILAAWNVSKLISVFKGDTTLASNYRPVSIMGPMAKLFATCLNRELE